MTVKALHKILSKMIAEGGGRAKVCISKDTFKHPLESDGCTILDVKGAAIQWVRMMDGDGFTDYRKDAHAQKSRANAVTQMLCARKNIYCLGVTKDRFPRHPLMVPYKQPLVMFEGSDCYP